MGPPLWGWEGRPGALRMALGAVEGPGPPGSPVELGTSLWGRVGQVECVNLRTVSLGEWSGPTGRHQFSITTRHERAESAVRKTTRYTPGATCAAFSSRPFQTTVWGPAAFVS